MGPVSLKKLWLVVLFLLVNLVSIGAFADTIAPAFSGSYQIHDLGTPLAVPGPLGGVSFLDNNTLLVGGNANNSLGAIYQIGLTRDISGHITGFSGPATLFATAPNNDGGLAFGPGGVLFYTGYPTNVIGQIKPGSTTPDKVINLGPLGISGSVGTLQFAPNGELKVLSYAGGGQYTCSLAADGTGTYNISGCTLNSSPGRGPEGMVYVPAGSPGFAGNYALVSEYSTGTVGAYQVDANYNLIAGTRQDFITSLSGAQGAVIDPLTGDFLFSTFGGGNHIDVVTGFAAPPPVTAVPEPASIMLFGTGLAGLAGAVRKKFRR